MVDVFMTAWTEVCRAEKEQVSLDVGSLGTRGRTLVTDPIDILSVGFVGMREINGIPEDIDCGSRGGRD
jgi:hypothetical protein